MEADVFAYFVSIGAGLSLGLSLGVVPAVMIYRFIKRRENGYGIHQTKKHRAG